MADSDFAMLREAAEFAMAKPATPKGFARGRAFQADAGLVLTLLEQRNELLGVLRELNVHVKSLAEMGWPGPARLIESTLAHLDGAR